MATYYYVFTIICLLLLSGVTYLLKKGHLREKYALLWIFIAVVMPISFVNPKLIERLSLLIGIKYPPTLVFIGAFLGLLLLVLMLSVIDSHQTNRIISLSQKVALLENDLDDLRSSLSGNKKNT